MNKGVPDFIRQSDVRPGRYPFVRRILPTLQENVTKEVWTEVSPGQVKYQTKFGKRKRIKARR